MFYAYLVSNGEGYEVASVNTESEYAADMKKLERADLDRWGDNTFVPYGSPGPCATTRHMMMVDSSDETVGAILGFFEAIGAHDLKRYVSDKLDNGRICVYQDPLGDSSPEKAAKRSRATEMLKDVLYDLGVYDNETLHEYEKAFDEFYEDPTVFEGGRSYSRLREHAGLLLSLKGDVSNEGHIILKDPAYEEMIDLNGYDLEKDCGFVVKHIQSIFENVANHYMREFNGNASADKQLVESDVPEFRVKVERFSRCMLPTFIVTDRRGEKDDMHVEVKVNEFFVKLMARLADFNGFRSHARGDIRELEGAADRPTDRLKAWEKEYPILNLSNLIGDRDEPHKIGNLYFSILYSAVIHEVRGHFPENEKWGFFEYRPDEIIAQGERGGSRYLYVNVLAMLYYWLIVLEHTSFPLDRVSEFMEDHPEMVRGLTKEQREDLPRHLMQLCNDQRKREEVCNYPFPARMVGTGVDAGYYKRTFLSKDGKAGNEGPVDLSAGAFERMPDLSGVPFAECGETEKRIREIFEDVAVHEIRKHNEAYERGEKEHRIPEETPDMPRGRIVVDTLSEALVPTAVVTKDGTIYINRNFVRVMELLRRKGADTPDQTKGAMMARGVRGPVIESTLFDSIIYSIALHEIRGHFPLEGYGFGVFDPDEEHAQGERGKSSLYNNLLAILYYWIDVVEEVSFPQKETERLMREHPYLFQGLTDEQKEMLPRDVKKFCLRMTMNHVSVYVDEYVDTGVTKHGVMRSVAERFDGDAAMNEGRSTYASTSDQETVYSPAAVFRLIGKMEGVFAEEDLLSVIGSKYRPQVKEALKLLAAGGYIYPVDDDAYRATMIQPEHADRIEQILSEGIGEDTYFEVLRILEKTPAAELAEALNSLARTDGKVNIFLETDWIPDEQMMLMRPLIQEIRKVADQNGNRLIVQKREEKGNDLIRRALLVKAKHPSEKTIFLGSESVVNQGKMISHLKQGERVTVIGVSSENINPGTYIKLSEMLRMAVKLAFSGMESLADDKGSSVDWLINGDGSFTFIQQPIRPMDLERIRRVYESQIRAVSRSA
ncbi:MAG: hypothetical protein GF392_06375 [Candidatus Omnitrophica bacterium]|nr:hypothetical protein [Candidatus Omnitrophota bacterium]